MGCEVFGRDQINEMLLASFLLQKLYQYHPGLWGRENVHSAECCRQQRPHAPNRRIEAGIVSQQARHMEQWQKQLGRTFCWDSAVMEEEEEEEAARLVPNLVLVPHTGALHATDA